MASLALTFTFATLLAMIDLSVAFDRQDFLVHFLNLKNCHHAVLLDCLPDGERALHDRVTMFRHATERGTSLQFVNLRSGYPGPRQPNVTTLFTPRQPTRLCCVLDYECPGASAVLEEVSRYRFMNNTYSWLLLPRQLTRSSALTAERMLWNVSGIQLNSDLITIEWQTGETRKTINLFDIHSKGRHLCKDIYRSLYGWWRPGEPIQLAANYNSYRVRQDFNFLQLRGVTVIDRRNVTHDRVEQLLSEPGLTEGIVAFVKYHYALLVVLRDFHNFTIKFRPTRGWAGRLRRSGYRLGLLGVVQRHETDVAATGIIMRLSRQPELDSIHYSWAFETGFVYKITPDIGSKSEGNGFVAPFSRSVWLTFVLSLGLAMAVLKYLPRLSVHRLESDTNPSSSPGTYLLDVVACVAQQGVAQVSRFVPSRVAILVLLVANLVLYNYYTSTVVSGLLSAQMVGPESIPEVIDSSLKVSLTDTGYHHIMLREQTLPYSTDLYERKARPARSPSELPLFTDVDHAVPFLRRGGHALHCELTEVYPALAKQFTANEICELRTVEGLFGYDIRVMAFVLPKHSMYSELFKTTLMRAQETGIVKRIYRIHKTTKPICQGSATVYSVALSEVSLAFIILGAGLALSGLIYLAEKKRESIRAAAAAAEDGDELV
ncbi:ionotropic receptor 75a-like [Anopheles aquasalis]|uniref:ionotropic receptor 75a-like n=1 Tax=Anopheles aquasalis TaxID=42839 RepID=UPI00215A2ABC|nr:ionotropic receptor 75a-like [Anopheles aquasalis]